MTDAHGVARDQLRAFIERIERLSEEAKTIADDIRDVKAEAKSMGYSVKAINQLLKLRKMDDQQRMEEEMVLSTYLAALGMIPDFEPETPSADVRAEGSGAGSAAPLQMRPETVSEMPETANDMVGGYPVAAAPFHAEETGAKGRGEEDAHENVVVKSVTAGETATSCEYCDDTGDVHRLDGEWLGFCHCEYGKRLKGASEFEIAPASQGEAEAPSSDERKSPADGMSGEGANTGGSHVDAHEDAAKYQAGPDLVRNARPATPGAATTEIDPPFPMKRAPFAHCFPELTKAQYDDLFAAIDAAGKIEEPIIRKGDVILDGWARYNIARSLGEIYPVLEYDGDDELLDVIRWQRSSRDWTTQQEAKIAKDLAKEFPHRSEDIWAAFHIAELPDGEIVAA